MEALKIGRRETFPFEERNRQRVAQGHHHRCRGRRRESHRARLAGARQQQHHIGRLGQDRFGPAGNRDQRDLEAPRIGDDIGQLRTFTGIRQGEDRIIEADHAEVAVACLGRMDEKGRGPGRGQRRRDLPRDMAAFAHSSDDQPAPHRRADIEREPERAVERLR